MSAAHTSHTPTRPRGKAAATLVTADVRPRVSGYLLVEDVAAELGVSRATVGEWASRCLIPHRKLPGRRRIFIPRDDFQAWMDGAELEVRRLADGGRVVKPRRIGG